jgi:hypothetical protein
MCVRRVAATGVVFVLVEEGAGTPKERSMCSPMMIREGTEGRDPEGR